MSSPTIITPDQRQMSGGSALANQHWSGMWPINVFPMSPRYLACLKSGMVTPEKSNRQWEGKTGSEGKPGRGVASVAVAFSQWNTVVVPPWHYKKSIPLDTGNLLVQDEYESPTHSLIGRNLGGDMTGQKSCSKTTLKLPTTSRVTWMAWQSDNFGSHVVWARRNNWGKSLPFYVTAIYPLPDKYCVRERWVPCTCSM